MADIPMPRGVRDFLPNEALFRNKVIQTVESVFQRFGFLTIETPKIESLDLLKAKNAIGEENKLIFEIAQENLGLRYDMTVSLARYVAMHQDLPLPFKRYCIGLSWRMDEPQRLRYREFTQADIDIVGGSIAAADAEIIGAAAATFDALGIAVDISLNSREIIEQALVNFGVSAEKLVGCMRILDKFDKQGRDGIQGLLNGYVGEEISSKLMAMIDFQGTNEEKIRYAAEIAGEDAVKELKETIDILETYKLKQKVSVDLTVIRGLDYYTGIVLEMRIDRTVEINGNLVRKFDVVGGGGRYSNLVKNVGGRDLGGVGVALGIDRILDVLDFTKQKKKSVSDVFVANIKQSNFKYALTVANLLREKGIPADINLAERNISNQLSYASNIGYRFVLVVGDSEEKNGTVKIKDMVSGKEEEVESGKLQDFFSGNPTR